MDPNESSRIVKIGKCLSSKLAEKLADFLQKNQDVFTWTHADMMGIHPNVMCHWLNIDHKLNQYAKTEEHWMQIVIRLYRMR